MVRRRKKTAIKGAKKKELREKNRESIRPKK